jgi:hypothetical protein
MNCIYCLQDSITSKGVPHVFPEAFVQNELTLPIGAVCDSCNNYLGHELDSVFITHPVLSMLAQFLRFPGKNGRLRKQLGNVELDVEPRSITIPCSKPKISTHPDGSTSAIIEPLIDPRFDFQKFRRAIHHIAFNAFALKRGTAVSLEPRFDPIRKYVRNPNKGDSWPFAQYTNLDANFSRDVTIMLDGDDDTEFVGIVLCAGMAFGVDLLNTGGLKSWVEPLFPATTKIVGPNYHVPRSQRQSRKGPRYRFTIYLDE